jgi:hypothetical protein
MSTGRGKGKRPSTRGALEAPEDGADTVNAKGWPARNVGEKERLPFRLLRL